MNVFAEIILPLALKSNFTYRIPEEMKEAASVGKRVLVRFGGKTYDSGKLYTGIIRKLYERPPQMPPAAAQEIRLIEEILDDTPVLFEAQMATFTWMAFYYACTEGEVLKAALPAGLKPESSLRIAMIDGLPWETLQTSDKEYVLLDGLSIQPVLTLEEVCAIWGIANPLPRLRAMQARGWLRLYQEVDDAYKPRFKKFLRIADAYLADEKALAEALDGLHNAPAQENLMLHILGAYYQQQPVPKDEALKALELTSGVVKALIKKGLIAEDEVQIDRLALYGYAAKEKHITLTAQQETALAQVRASFSSDAPSRPVLLNGITGSGKTHIYIELIREVLAKGKQVLYLLPEITLTKQIVDKVKAAFGDRVGIYHSRFNDNERVEIWQKVCNVEYDVVIGVRSAVFLPFKNLGLIVVDEEHDDSFKQQEPAPRYNARDVAIYYAHSLGIPIVLGSATPCFESYQNALAGKFLLVELTQRAIAATLPAVVLVDMRQEYKRKTVQNGVFSSVLFEEMCAALERKEQIILFQNRRGYAPYLTCLTCGTVPMCVNCDISLTFHKEKNFLRCHYCGHTEYQTQSCKTCGNYTMNPKGLGTEKIEEQVQVLFPNHTVARMDLDTTRSKFGFQNLITQFEAQQIDILVGTQMVSKGLDFENVTLVGIINADAALTYPDFRAYEKAYHLLTQVSGRAGRSTKKGRVIVQTSMPENVVLQHIQKPYAEFYQQEAPNRQPLGYPPFTRVVRIETAHKDRDFIEAETRRLDAILRPHFGSNLLGPDYALIARVRNLYRMQFFLKVAKNLPPKLLRELLQSSIVQYYEQASPKTLRVILDIDPL